MIRMSSTILMVLILSMTACTDKKNDLTEEQQKAREEFYKVDKLNQPYKKGQFKEDGK